MSEPLFTTEDVTLVQEAADVMDLYAVGCEPEARKRARLSQSLALSGLRGRLQQYLDQQPPERSSAEPNDRPVTATEIREHERLFWADMERQGASAALELSISTWRDMLIKRLFSRFT